MLNELFPTRKKNQFVVLHRWNESFTSEKPISTKFATAASHSGSRWGPWRTLEWEKDEQRRLVILLPLAYTLAQCRAVFSNNLRSFLYWFATTATRTLSRRDRKRLRRDQIESFLPASWGSSGSGVANKACRLSRTVRRVIAAALKSMMKRGRVHFLSRETETRRTIDLWEYRGK